VVVGVQEPAEPFPPMHFAFVACMLRLGLKLLNRTVVIGDIMAFVPHLSM